MPAVANWALPTEFTLTNPFNGSMQFNVQTVNGLYLLDQSGCDFQIAMRTTVDNVPQSDGYILHNGFLTGTQMPLTIQLWEEPDKPACGILLQEMLDNLSGALRSLKNAGDNEGRISWTVDGYGDQKMLDDIRLFVYPSYKMDSLGVVTVTVVSKYPYAQDLTPHLASCDDGNTVTIDNTGTAAYFPVIQVNKLATVTQPVQVDSFTIQNLTTGAQFDWTSNLPGASAIGANHYAELECFNNTMYLDGNSSNKSSGILQLDSDYFTLEPGPNDLTITGAPMDVLWAPAWG